MKRPALLFGILCCCCILAIVVFGELAVRKSAKAPRYPTAGSATVIVPSRDSSSVTSTPAPSVIAPETPPKTLADTPAVPATSNLRPRAPARSLETTVARKFLFFRTNALGENYGKLSVAQIDSLNEPRYAFELSCDRVHFSGDKGICLTSDRGMFTKYYAVMFDKNLKPGWRIPLNGLPSRTRVSPSGRLAAITIFLSGHSYVSLNFSTQTLILNSVDGRVLADLETFTVTREGRPFQSPDFNFWGVTFAQDENQIYATLWSKGKTYLVKCNLRSRSATVIYDGVECPSLSPDNTRIAFKKRVESSRVAWRIHVLDLKTMTATPTGETHSIDDQVEWLDNDHVLYSRSESETGSSASTDIWEVATGREETPELLLQGAFSPAVAWMN